MWLYAFLLAGFRIPYVPMYVLVFSVIMSQLVSQSRNILIRIRHGLTGIEYGTVPGTDQFLKD
jgi:hypothetical protein